MTMSEEINRDIGPRRIDDESDEDTRPLPLEDLLGSPARMKLTIYFLDYPDMGWKTKTGIADDTDSSRATIIKHIDALVEYGIVKTRGNERLQYAPYVESTVYQALQDINQALYHNYITEPVEGHLTYEHHSLSDDIDLEAEESGVSIAGGSDDTDEDEDEGETATADKDS